jgi:putative ABC transport system ATP-binding protein
MSRGQMQRVAVARALVGGPGLIVADEPTASLDAESGAAVAGLLLELAGETDATLIVATHDDRLTGRLDRALRLENGCLTA